MTMPLIRFLPEAVEDLLETQRWYGRREPALAWDFAESFAAAVERIRRDPRSFPLIHGQIRPLVLRQFPYGVYFREEGPRATSCAGAGRRRPRSSMSIRGW